MEDNNNIADSVYRVDNFRNRSFNTRPGGSMSLLNCLLVILVVTLVPIILFIAITNID